jgi:hypothetical protein
MFAGRKLQNLTLMRGAYTGVVVLRRNQEGKMIERGASRTLYIR